MLVQRTALPRKHAQGTAPRSEPRFAPADRDEIKSRGSMRLRPPRPPGERASRERQATEMLCRAEKVSVFGARCVCSASRADLAFPSEGKVPEGRMRCSANGASLRHKATFFALNTVPLRVTYTSSPPAGGAVSLRLVSVAVPQAELRVLVPTGNQFNTVPLLRSPRGEAKVRVVPRGSPSKQVLPRIRKLSLLYTKSLSAAAPGLPVPRGVSGGGAALSSLCRRFPGGDIMNLTSRRNPLRGLSFSLFFVLRERKRGYCRRRSYKISVG